MASMKREANEHRGLVPEVRGGDLEPLQIFVQQGCVEDEPAFRDTAEEVARYISIEAMKPELVILSKAR